MATKQSLLYIFLLVAALTQVHCQEDDSYANDVKVSCTGGTMTIRVHTKEPFEGVIHAINRTEPGCSKLGDGGLRTKFEIDLTRPEGSEGSCGVKYDPKIQETRVAIYVRKHPSIELYDDKLYIVRCGKAGFQNTRQETSFITLKVTDGLRKLDAVLEGSEQKLQVQVLNPDPEYGILVKNCFAFDNEDSPPVQLVDDSGCRTDKIISEFTYDDANFKAEATVYKMFRMAYSNRTYFQCDVEICKDACVRPECELTRQPAPTEVDPFSRRPADDTVTISTSVYVAEPGSAGAVGASLCSISDTNPTWLTWLCVAFGVLFGIMLLINIFLCSAMTCSCTKTEVIEKEPSIYDDYSVYDSQYGYTSKAYNSESDYGSEYGIEEGRIREPSDAGTLRSKYSRGDNTLSRSRNGGSRYLE
eukprot:TRINITY_DN11202_c0_g2_i4.p1 TRINITY_DN11202_c0_g2~~TRINITY_DN11202_c0_g2_i4.p1  ORF type:complete len:416 (-),score=87.23 TRINITY_DN11202_c0_g2_i4:495-1742(-)